jgi:hypothetical protein
LKTFKYEIQRRKQKLTHYTPLTFLNSLFSFFLLSLALLGGTQGLMLAKQALYHLSHSASP